MLGQIVVLFLNSTFKIKHSELCLNGLFVQTLISPTTLLILLAAAARARRVSPDLLALTSNCGRPRSFTTMAQVQCPFLPPRHFFRAALH